jgi:hypothetical protein
MFCAEEPDKYQNVTDPEHKRNEYRHRYSNILDKRIRKTMKKTV